MEYDELRDVLDKADEYLEKSEYAQAEEFAQQVLQIVPFSRGNIPFAGQGVQEDEASVQSAAATARALCILGTCCSNTSRYDEALTLHTNALSAAEAASNLCLQARALNGTAVVQRRRGDNTSALTTAGSALSCAERAGLIESVTDAKVIAEARKQQADTLDNIGSMYYNLADYPRALDFYTRAVAIAEELGNKNILAYTLNNIGGVHCNLADYTRALEYNTRALALAEELGNKNVMVMNLHSMSEAYKESGDFTLALEYLRRALSLSEQIGDRRGAGYCLHGIASVERKLGHLDASYQGFVATLHHRRDVLKTNEGVADTLVELGGILLEQSKTEEALARLTEAVTLADELGERKTLGNAHKELAEVYSRLDDSRRAFSHFKRFYELEKEVQSEDARKSSQRLMIAEQEKKREVEGAAERAQANATRELLDLILPSAIATRMISGEKHIADYFPAVSILFADIVGFTTIATQVPPDIVIDFLNYVFDVFDGIVKRHGCEKIKTIGDGYMAIAGAPLECSDHAERIARAAIEMQSDISLPDEIRSHLIKGTKFHIRIGIHTGAAVCGVIGRERFVWDVYSDAVNTAARMESNGEAGKIHLSKEFAWLLRSRQRLSKGEEEFVLEERGEIEIKGKGMMRTYFLLANAQRA